jgi:hypothetical protein
MQSLIYHATSLYTFVFSIFISLFSKLIFTKKYYYNIKMEMKSISAFGVLRKALNKELDLAELGISLSD